MDNHMHQHSTPSNNHNMETNLENTQPQKRDGQKKQNPANVQLYITSLTGNEEIHGACQVTWPTLRLHSGTTQPTHRIPGD